MFIAECMPEACSRSVPQNCNKQCARGKICIRKVYLLCTCCKLCQKYAVSVCQKCARNSVPKEKFAYEKYTGSALAPNCVRSMQQVCARSVRKTVCQRKKLHTKNILAASMPQIVAAQMLQMWFKYAAAVRHRAYILVRDVIYLLLSYHHYLPFVTWPNIDISNVANDRRKFQVWDFQGCPGRCQIFVRLY
jgi:hypothetical protein